MEQVWYTIEGHSGLVWDAKYECFNDEEGTEYDEYNDAAFVAKGLANCDVIRNVKPVGGVVRRDTVGSF